MTVLTSVKAVNFKIGMNSEVLNCYFISELQYIHTCFRLILINSFVLRSILIAFTYLFNSENQFL